MYKRGIFKWFFFIYYNMINGLNCTNCDDQFNIENKIPLVLPCGESICMQCLVSLINPLPKVLKCSVCWRSFEINNYFIKELPKNKALLIILRSLNQPNNHNGPSPKVLFSNTPEPKKIYESPDKIRGYSTPSIGRDYFQGLQFTSPNSVAIKCARPGCNNDRYYINGNVWEYCCLNCEKFDRNF